jgi:hypothetical protein
MLGVQKPIQLWPSPPWSEGQIDVERPGNRTQHPEGDLLEPAKLDQRSQLLRHARTPRNVDLSPAPAAPDGPNDPADDHIVHEAEDRASDSPEPYVEEPANWTRTRPGMVVVPNSRLPAGVTVARPEPATRYSPGGGRATGRGNVTRPIASASPTTA